MSRGRTDIRAAHRAFSTVLWTILAAAVVAANLYAAWVMSADPSAVAANGFSIRPADAGPWIEISGHARGARAELLYDTATGRFERTRTVDWRGPVLSGNGKRAAWVEGGDGGPPSHPLRIRALDDPSAKPVATRLLIEGYPTLLELSEDGSRLATWSNGVLAVHDVVSERTLASAKVPLGDQEELRGLFVGPDAFRAYRVGDRAIEILQLDAGTRKLERLGRIEGLVGRYFVTDASGSRLLKAGRGIQLYDGATGALLATLADERESVRLARDAPGRPDRHDRRREAPAGVRPGRPRAIDDRPAPGLQRGPRGLEGPDRRRSRAGPARRRLHRRLREAGDLARRPSRRLDPKSRRRPFPRLGFRRAAPARQRRDEALLRPRPRVPSSASTR